MPLHLLTEADRDLILPWRNAPEVRKQMYTQHQITSDEHRTWFERIKVDPRVRWYLYRDPRGEPMGVINFTDVDLEQKTAFWGFYTRPDAPAGTGTRILYTALENAFGELRLEKLNGETLATNVASIRLHKKCGFIQEGVFREQRVKGEQRIDVVRFGILAREWNKHRDRLRKRIEQLDA